MESHGYPGCVHCSESFVEALLREGSAKEDFLAKGTSAIKGKGLMQTYYSKVGAWRQVAADSALEEPSKQA